MKCAPKSTLKNRYPIAGVFILLAFFAITLLSNSLAVATPIDKFETMAGNYNFVVTGGTLRTSDTSQCDVTSSSTANLSGVTGGASIRAAYLYWAGSGSAPDWTVTFAGSSVTAASDPLLRRRFTAELDGDWWFGGVADVTHLVPDGSAANTSYTFEDLDVDTGGNHCYYSDVLAGWGLVVIYEHPIEKLRVINIFDGLQIFWGSAISLSVDNFLVPSSNWDGKFGVLTWEGDAGLSTSRGGFSEEVRFNGTTLPIDPWDPINPRQNQYNSTISDGNLFVPRTDVFGVDFDVYDISSALSSGLSSANTFYSSGQDLVLLMMEIISVTNEHAADLEITKSDTGDFFTGQQNDYTISVTNNGPGSATGTIRVTDTLPADLTFVSGTGTGWSNCSTSGQTVTCDYDTGASGLADDSSLPDLTLTVDVALTTPSSVTNTATVEPLDPSVIDFDDRNDTATITTTVFNLGPASGTKQLYYYLNNDTLRRTVPASSTNSANLSGGNSVALALSPITQTPLTLSAGGNDIRTSFWVRRNNNGVRNRRISVTLTYSDGTTSGTLGPQTRNIRFRRANQWYYHTFNFPVPAEIPLGPNATITATITHVSGSSGTIQLSSLNGTTASLVALDTSTVINVDSVAVYSDEDYPSGVPLTIVAPNTPVRIRAVVSDPFGHDDINSASITLTDPGGNPVDTNAAMLPIATPPVSPPGTKIFEYRYTIPATGPTGIWRATVTANEGTEGTISHSNVGTFQVEEPNIVITKSVATISDPTQGAGDPYPYAIPGATMEYEIVVTNIGIVPADRDSIIITDLLPDNLRLVLNSPIQPVEFIDGDQYGQSASGLTFNPIDFGDNDVVPYNAVALSNNGGSGTPSYLSVGGIGNTDGVDSTDPKINYIRINPKGIFAASTGGPHPSFTLRFRLKLQ